MTEHRDSDRPLLSGVVVLVVLIQLTLGPSRVFALDLQSKADIINLMLCYGTGTDVIGDSTRADPKGEGAAIYAQCFTDDASFLVWFPGTPFSGPPTNPPPRPLPPSLKRVMKRAVFRSSDEHYSQNQPSRMYGRLQNTT